MKASTKLIIQIRGQMLSAFFQMVFRKESSVLLFNKEKRKTTKSYEAYKTTRILD
jgi:hypothetical protein